MFLPNFSSLIIDPGLCLSCFSNDSQCGCSYSFNPTGNHQSNGSTQPPISLTNHQQLQLQHQQHLHLHHQQSTTIQPSPSPALSLPPPLSTTNTQHQYTTLPPSTGSSSNEATILTSSSTVSSSSSSNGYNYYSNSMDNLQNTSYHRHYHQRSNYLDSSTEAESSSASSTTTTTNHQTSDYGPVFQLYDESNYFGINYHHLCHSTKTDEFIAETTFPIDANQLNGLSTNLTNGNSLCTFYNGSSNQSFTFSNQQIESSTTSQNHHHHHHQESHHNQQQQQQYQYLQYQQYHHHRNHQHEQMYIDSDGNHLSPNEQSNRLINSDENGVTIIGGSENSIFSYNDYEMIIDTDRISSLTNQQTLCEQSTSPLNQHKILQQPVSPVTVTTVSPQPQSQSLPPTSPTTEVTSTTSMSPTGYIDKNNSEQPIEVKLSQLEIETINVPICENYHQEYNQENQQQSIYPDSKWLINQQQNHLDHKLDHQTTIINNHHHHHPNNANNNNAFINDCPSITNNTNNQSDQQQLTTSTILRQSTDHYINSSSSSIDDHSSNIDFTRFWVNGDNGTEVTSCPDYFDLKSRSLINEPTESYIIL